VKIARMGKKSLTMVRAKIRLAIFIVYLSHGRSLEASQIRYRIEVYATCALFI